MPPPPSQESGAQGSMDVLWGAAFILILSVICWWKGKELIITAVFGLRIFELGWIADFWPGAWGSREALLLAKSHAADLTYQDFLVLLDESGQHFRFFFSGILSILGFYLMFVHVRSKFKTMHTMKTLIDTERDVWKHIRPVADLDLVEAPLMEGPWSMSLNPLEFARAHHLLIEHRQKPTDQTFLQEEVITVSINQETADRVFTAQMGRPWTRAEDLAIHEKALFAVFAARAEQDRESAHALLQQISESAQSLDSSLNFNGAEALLEKHKNSKQVQKILNQHAYVLTVMASMLELGRTDGIIATAEFLWLKPRDRTLWYMLNNVGRQTAYAEVAGPFAHWLIEKRMRRKLFSPMVREASKALEMAINDTLYTPLESEEQ